MPGPAAWWKRLSRAAPRDRTELAVMLGALGVLVLVSLFFLLAGEVLEGDTQEFDTRVLTALRRPDNPSMPIGPAWLQSGALDITALGGPTVLGLATLAICGFLVLQGMARTAAFVFVAATGGWLLNEVLKQVFQRARPTSCRTCGRSCPSASRAGTRCPRRRCTSRWGR